MKHVLITGGAGANSIGRAITVHLLGLGHRVLVLDNDPHALAEMNANLKQDALATVALDLADAAAVEAFIAAIRKAESVPGVLINNAAITHFETVLETPLEMWEQMMAVNLRAPFLLSRGFASLWIERKMKGAILNVVSVNASKAKEMIVPYCCSKAALKLLGEGLAVELGKFGIRVNAIAPGDTQTDIVRQEEVKTALKDLDFTKGVPLGRRGLPQDMAAAAAFLISDEAEFISGATLTIDGGASAGDFFPVRLPDEEDAAND